MNYDFTIKDTDTHTWAPAVGTDVADIIELSNTHFTDESAGMLKVDLHRGAKLITESIVNQLYYPNSEFVIVARHKETNKLGAWAWSKRNCLMEYSSEETTELRMIHIDKTLPTRDKVALVGQAVSIWHMWAQMNNIPVMVSATLRSQQRAFLRILEALGFTLNGSYAFLRTQIVVEPQQDVVEKPAIYVPGAR